MEPASATAGGAPAAPAPARARGRRLVASSRYFAWPTGWGVRFPNPSLFLACGATGATPRLRRLEGSPMIRCLVGALFVLGSLLAVSPANAGGDAGDLLWQATFDLAGGHD